MPGRAVSVNWLILWPIGSVLLSAAIAVVVYWKWNQNLDAFLAKNQKRRLFFGIFFILLVPAGALLLADIADLSEAGKGNLDGTGAMLLSLGALLGVAYLWGQTILWSHADKWDERLIQNAEEIKKLRSLKSEIESQRDYVLSLTERILAVVRLKWKAIRGVVASVTAPGGVSSQMVRDAVDPDRQMTALVRAMHDIYRERLNAIGNRSAKLRIAHFRLEDGYLKPIETWDGQSDDCITRPANEHRGKFKIDGCASECLAVRAAHTGRVEFAEDAEECNQNSQHSFKYFSGAQRDRIRSMVAMALRADDGGSAPFEHVIAIDTDQVGFFNEAKHEQEFELARRHLAHRLLFEEDVKKLFALQGD